MVLNHAFTWQARTEEVERQLRAVLPAHVQFAWLDYERALVIFSSAAAASNLLRQPPGKPPF